MSRKVGRADVVAPLDQPDHLPTYIPGTGTSPATRLHPGDPEPADYGIPPYVKELEEADLEEADREAADRDAAHRDAAHRDEADRDEADRDEADRDERTGRP